MGRYALRFQLTGPLNVWCFLFRVLVLEFIASGVEFWKLRKSSLVIRREACVDKV